jgi:single-stranded-DNA-specific exonuclease
MLALRTLLENDRAKAYALVDELERVQAQRKDLDRRLRATIEAAITAERLHERSAIVVGDDGWHHGLVGIAAGRIAQKHGRPTVVLAFDGEVGTGSVRGPDGFPLHDALKRCNDTLLGFGGHQAAAGVRVSRANYLAFREAFEHAVDAIAPQYQKPAGPLAVPYDGRDSLRALATDWQRFEPCGAANAAPVIAFAGVEVRAVRLMGKGAYAKLVVRVGAEEVGVWLGETPPSLPREGARVDLRATPRFDDFRGGGAVELVAQGEVRAHG